MVQIITATLRRISLLKIMGKLFKQNCKGCKNYYEGRGSLFCSTSCSGKDKERIEKHSKAITGRPSPLKGMSFKRNDALKIWRENGGTPWNKNLKDIHLSPLTEFTSERTTGDKNVNWKGGVSGEHRTLRKSKEHKEWSEGVYKKNNWHCVDCDTKCQKGNIVAHHLQNFADFVGLRFDIENGVTLCRSCHAKRHNPFNRFTKVGNSTLNFTA